MERLPVLTAIIVVCVLGGVPGAVAQLREPSEPSPVFPRDIVRIGDPFPVTLCHIPPGNPSNAHTIEVDQAAVPTHMAHGDLMGECPYECNAAPVAKTGQTTVYGPGDDGEYQYGVSVDPRFTDNGDGTVTDNLTGLIWLQNANCIGTQSWLSALSEANTLADDSCGLTDGSVAGDWRLPNIRELHSLIDYGNHHLAFPIGHPFSGVQSSGYWSSTSTAEFWGGAWYMHLGVGFTYSTSKTIAHYVWPVRGPE